MATKWEKVRKISRVRPDSDDGITDDCNDSLDDSKVFVIINGEYSLRTDEQGFKPKFYQGKPAYSRSQPILTQSSYDFLRLPVPQDTGRQNTCDEAGRTTLRRTSSAYSLLSGNEIDGDIPTRSHSFLKNAQRILVKDLFTKHESRRCYDLKVRLHALFTNKAKTKKPRFFIF